MNGTTEHQPLQRAAEVEDLINAVRDLIIPYIRSADRAAPLRATGQANIPNGSGPLRMALVEGCKPAELVQRLALSLPKTEGRGKEGLLDTIQDILRYSVNTWDQGFLDKLYASTNAVGVVSELLLSALNTNVHVYQVSPALTVIEKHTAQTLANLFGFDGPRAGGITCQGGSSSNLTSLVIARNVLYPETKVHGTGSKPFVLFTSEHGHYSVEKAAVACGFGSASVQTVPVDAEGRMIPSVLRDLVVQAKAEGKTPLYVNATAGTTVLGSYDPFEEISAVCKEYGLWLHVDASWGGPVVFSSKLRYKLAGSHLADSLTVNPHKMMNVPLTCSFLLGPDMGVFHQANTLPAGYLFHGPGDDDDTAATTNGSPAPEFWDLADLTLQCGRRGDSLKLALSWIYYGAAGFEKQVEGAFELAAYFAEVVSKKENFILLSSNPPPCLQVCFYYAPGGKLAEAAEENTARTRVMVAKLVQRSFMVDYAPGDKGSFFRVVVNCQTRKGTVDGLVKAIEEIGTEVV